MGVPITLMKDVSSAAAHQYMYKKTEPSLVSRA